MRVVADDRRYPTRGRDRVDRRSVQHPVSPAPHPRNRAGHDQAESRLVRHVVHRRRNRVRILVGCRREHWGLAGVRRRRRRALVGVRGNVRASTAWPPHRRRPCPVVAGMGRPPLPHHLWPGTGGLVGDQQSPRCVDPGDRHRRGRMRSDTRAGLARRRGLVALPRFRNQRRVRVRGHHRLVHGPVGLHLLPARRLHSADPRAPAAQQASGSCARPRRAKSVLGPVRRRGRRLRGGSGSHRDRDRSTAASNGGHSTPGGVGGRGCGTAGGVQRSPPLGIGGQPGRARTCRPAARGCDCGRDPHRGQDRAGRPVTGLHRDGPQRPLRADRAPHPDGALGVRHRTSAGHHDDPDTAGPAAVRRVLPDGRGPSGRPQRRPCLHLDVRRPCRPAPVRAEPPPPRRAGHRHQPDDRDHPGQQSPLRGCLQP